VSAFIGPVLVAVLGGAANMTVLIWTFAALYIAAALVSRVLRTSEDPGQKALGAPIVPAEAARS
jgi:hypothetical protein